MDGLHQIRNMSGHLHAAEASPNDDNGEQPLARLRFGLGHSRFKVADQVVAQDNGVDDSFQRIAP